MQKRTCKNQENYKTMNIYFKKLKRIEKSFNLKISKANMKMVLGIPGKYKHLKEKNHFISYLSTIKTKLHKELPDRS